MSRLASVLTALWLSSAAAHPGFLDTVKKTAANELQAASDPAGKLLAAFGGALCPGVKKIFGVAYENAGSEPDMSQLTLQYMTDGKTIIYKLAEAAKEIPKDNWWNKKLVIYLHGFTDNPSKSSFQTMLAAFKSKDNGDVNILALDASSLIKFFYLRASTVVRFIGAFLGTIIAALVPAGLELKNVHLLGHSLGSHIAGFAGKTVLELTGDLIGRISSMDPAGPCFSVLTDSERLFKNDATFVDVIHTDMGVYGLDQLIGHVDFLVNSGSQQPGCLLQTCSHSRAWEYYAESVTTSTKFEAVQCKDYTEFRQGNCNVNDTSVMGYFTPSTTRGLYYLMTYDEEPYAAGDTGLTYNEKGFLTKLKWNIVDLFSG